MQKRLILTILSIFIFTSLVTSLSVDFVSPTPSNGSTQSNHASDRNVQFYINASSTNNIGSFVLWYNNTNYTIYDASVILYYGFNNNSNLGEGINSSLVYDYSQTGGNGTIQNSSAGSIFWNYTGGRYNGAYNFIGMNDSGWIKINRPSISNSTDFTISAWILPYPAQVYGDNNYIIRYWGYNQMSWRNQSGGQCNGNIFYYNLTGSSKNTFPALVNCPIGNWTHYAIVRTGNNYSVYINGVIRSSINITDINANQIGEGLGSDYKIGYSSSYPQFNRGAFNGSIDELIIFNRSLSSNEIYGVYSSNYNKINASSISVVFNFSKQSMGNKVVIAYMNDSSGNFNSSILSFNLRVYSGIVSAFNSLIGRVNNYFYGSNTHVKNLAYGFNIDTDGDGTLDTVSNTTWHRETWLNSRQTNERGDMYLTTYYQNTITNKNAELITNLTYLNWNGSSRCNSIVNGWCFSTANAGGNYGQIFSQSTDAHSGSYSLNVTSNSTGTGIAFVYWTLTLPANHTYNFSAWIKTSNTTTFKAGWNDGAVNVASNTSTGSGAWTFRMLNFTSNDTYSSMRIDMSADPGESFLVDDVQYYQDNKPYIFNRIKSLENQTELVDWATGNNQVIYYIADRPSSATIPTNCLINNETYFLSYCKNKINYTEYYTEIVMDFVKTVTKNKTNLDTIRIEVTNEPYYYDDYLLNTTTDSLTGALEWINLYNTTYNVLKNYDSSLIVGGPSGYRNAPNLSKTFISNLTNRWDFFDIHPYRNNYTNSSNSLVTDILQILNICVNYSANCSQIVLSEWNSNYYSNGISILNDSSQLGNLNLSTAFAYLDVLNTYPSNVTSQMYQWHELYPTTYSSYPDSGYRYAMTSEPAQQNSLYETYYITKQFATFHPSGATVYSSSSDYSPVYVVCSVLSSMYSCTVINSDSDSVNETANFSNYPFFHLMDMSNGNLIPTSSNTNLGILNSYDVKTFSTPNLNAVEGDKLYKMDYYGNNISTSTNEIWFSVQNATNKHIANNLTTSIYSILTFNVTSCESINQITYTSHGGTYSRTFNKQDLNCSGNQVSIFALLEPSLNSNEINISYIPNNPIANGGTVGSVNTPINNTNITLIPSNQITTNNQTIVDKINNVVNKIKSKLSNTEIFIIFGSIFGVIFIVLLLLAIHQDTRKNRKKR